MKRMRRPCHWRLHPSHNATHCVALRTSKQPCDVGEHPSGAEHDGELLVIMHPAAGAIDLFLIYPELRHRLKID